MRPAGGGARRRRPRRRAWPAIRGARPTKKRRARGARCDLRAALLDATLDPDDKAELATGSLEGLPAAEVLGELVDVDAQTPSTKNAASAS